MTDVVQELKDLNVRGILIKTAQQGCIKEVKCQMSVCLCPAVLGGPTHFEPVPDELPDWMPTADHIELKSEGGQLTVENVALGHRLCNRARYAIEKYGEPHKKDRERVERARERAISGGSDRESQRRQIIVRLEALWAVQPDRTLVELLSSILDADQAAIGDVTDEELLARLSG